MSMSRDGGKHKTMQVRKIIEQLKIFTKYPNFRSLNVAPLIFLLLFIKEQNIGIPFATFIAITEQPRKALKALVDNNENVPSITEVNTAKRRAFRGTVSWSVVVFNCCQVSPNGSPWSLAKEYIVLDTVVSAPTQAKIIAPTIINDITNETRKDRVDNLRIMSIGKMSGLSSSRRFSSGKTLSNGMIKIIPVIILAKIE